MDLKNTFYILASVSLTLIFGAAIYEHVSVWPNGYAEVPRSLTMFQGKYALESAPFWKTIHPVTFVLMLIALALNWRSERKIFILISVLTYVLILLVTFIFFVPELISVLATPYSDTANAALQRRANLWVNLSLIRLAIGLVATFILLTGLTKSATKL